MQKWGNGEKKPSGAALAQGLLFGRLADLELALRDQANLAALTPLRHQVSTVCLLSGAHCEQAGSPQLFITHVSQRATYSVARCYLQNEQTVLGGGES